MYNLHKLRYYTTANNLETSEGAVVLHFTNKSVFEVKKD